MNEKVELEQEYKRKRNQYLISIRKKNRNQFLNTKRRMFSQINVKDDKPLNHNKSQSYYSQKHKEENEKGHDKDEKEVKQYCPSSSSYQDLDSKIDLSSQSERLYGPKQKLKRSWLAQTKQFTIIVDKQLEGLILQIMKNPLGEQQLQQAIKLSHQIENCQNIHKGIISLRKIISKRNIDRQNLILQIIDNDLLTVFINLLNQDIFKQLKFQCLWILTNIAESHHYFCERIVQREGIPPILAILKKRDEYLVDQALWALGNIAADCLQYKQMILQLNGLHEIIEFAMETKKKQLFDSCVWAAINLCSECNYKKYSYQICKTIDLLCAALIAGFLDESDTYDQALGMIYLNTQHLFKRIVQTGITAYLIEAFSKKDNLQTQTRNVILKILTKFSEGDQFLIQNLLNHGILELIHGALLNNADSIVESALFILSNLVLGTTEQVDIIFEDKNIFPICKLLLEEGSEGVQYQACYVFLNVFNYGERSKVIQLYKQINAVEVINSILQSNNSNLLQIALKLLLNVLVTGQQEQDGHKNPFIIEVLNSTLINKLQELQFHSSQKIGILIKQIIEYFFFDNFSLACENSFN